MIHLLWCTIRPNQFIKAHREWMKNSDNPSDIRTYTAVNNPSQKEVLMTYLDLSKSYIITMNSNKIGVCAPAYTISSRLGINLGKCEEGDIVVFASDDFMAPKGWDTYLKNKLEGKGDVGLMVRDGYQLPDSSNMLHPAITIPIMTYGCLRKMNGIIYHPAYNHMFSDCELYNNLKDMDLLYDDRMSDETVFEHLHWAAGKRQGDQADQAYNAKWADDEITWKKRSEMSVEERIKVNL
jgi:hypothetical protein